MCMRVCVWVGVCVLASSDSSMMEVMNSSQKLLQGDGASDCSSYSTIRRQELPKVVRSRPEQTHHQTVAQLLSDGFENCGQLQKSCEPRLASKALGRPLQGLQHTSNGQLLAVLRQLLIVRQFHRDLNRAEVKCTLQAGQKKREKRSAVH